MSKVVLEKEVEGKNLVIRYPKKEDAKAMLDYINTLSKEKTFIRFQGEQLTLKQEKEFLADRLEKIKNKKAVQLLAFLEGKLIGNSEITLKEKVEKHIGVFGISVSKEARGKGTGKLLMETVISESAKQMQDLKLVELEVFANNPVGHSLYKNLGFVKYGELPGGIKHKGKFVNSILMYKKISRS